ncbi:MAG: hypothetical protein ACREMK_10010 [Gemmatimonadota bacterium]
MAIDERWQGHPPLPAHEYLEIDVAEVVRWRGRILDGIPLFITELEQWLDTVEATGESE